MRKIIILAIAAALIFPFSAMAAYPEKPIKLIVPSKAGGSTDTSARLFIKAAKKYWPGAEFVIKNVGGSGGLKGFEEIARAKPNGYTIGMMFTTQIVAYRFQAGSLYPRQFSYHRQRDAGPADCRGSGG